MKAPHPQPILFQRYPELAARVPFTRLGCPNTSVEPLTQLGRRLGREIWVKRDDLYGSPGGGKIRKLEFSLAEMLRQGRRTLITFGPLGSNHVAATATHASRLGIETLGVLVPQPMQHYVRGNLERSCGFARVVFARWSGTAAIRAIQLWLRERIAAGRAPALLAPGGSSACGILGYVEAALEIGRDVRAGRIPEPDFAFIPAGTCGALAGMVAGLRIAGLNTRAIGVRVAGRLACNATTTRWLANRVLSFLRARGATPDLQSVRARDFKMLHGFCGRGYAHATSAGKQAMALVHETQGLTLDATYTGKAMAGLIEFMARPEQSKSCALFVNTWAPPTVQRTDNVSRIPGHIEAWLRERETAPTAGQRT
ncbi:D-cysteine desulfhydrase [Planctomycetaceae bacterium]|nr:D-cysteine desulfhydrase [Planctomycetaceae bacterium]